MLLELNRDTYTNKTTIGKLYINGRFECDTLEDIIRPEGIKVYGETAIPKGKYHLTIDYSPHFKREMVHVLDVPGFSGIRIHSGNKAEDTEGCILLGTRKGKDWITESGKAYLKFFPKINAAYEAEEEIILKIT